MQKLGISLLFFTLCFTSVSFGQGGAKNYSAFPNIDSLLRQVNIDSIVGHFHVDSLLKASRFQLAEADSALCHINVDSIVHRINIDSIMHRVNIDSIMHRINIDSIMRRVNIDSLWKAHKPAMDSLIRLGFGSLTPQSGNLKNFASSEVNPHYFLKNGERYYIDILPSTQKGERVDSSYVWLINSK